MTIPRELKLVGGKIFMTPIKELENLRTSEKNYKNISIDKAKNFDGVCGEVGELCLTCGAKEKFSVKIRDALKIFYDPETSTVKIIREGLGDEKLAGEREAKISSCEELNFRIYIDKSSVEIFVNEGEAVFSARIYPQENSQEITFIPEENNFAIKEINFYNLEQAVPNPRM